MPDETPTSQITSLERFAPAPATASEYGNKLTPNLWINNAVQACLNAALLTNERYVFAVSSLEAVLSPKQDALYKAELERWEDEDAPKISIDKRADALAKFKFEQCMRLIDRMGAVEQTIQL